YLFRFMQKKKVNKPHQPQSKKPPAKVNKNDQRTQYVLLAVILLISFIIYLPSLSGTFVWDDGDYVQNNNLIRTINLKEIFSHYVVGNYHPLTVLTFAIEYQLFGIAEKGYHVVNLLLHLLNVLLVFRVVLLLSDKSWVALIAAFLF